MKQNPSNELKKIENKRQMEKTNEIETKKRMGKNKKKMAET